MKRLSPRLFALLVGLASGCGGTETTNTGTMGGNSGVGGDVGGGVVTAGGSMAATGSTNQGGTPTTGTDSGRAGASNIGGGVTNGGSFAAGGLLAAGGTSTNTGGSKATGGAPSTGGILATGGSKATGGALSTGGTHATGGTKATGGALSTGGTLAAGGSKATGGTVSTGGSNAAGGTSSPGGSNAIGGTGTCTYLDPTRFAIGADVSQVPQDEEGGNTRFVDTDGSQKDVLDILKKHGFNYLRLRTFVDPKAADGYSPQGYCDIDHTVAMGKRIKQACMGFLLDFHYSDTWADPDSQCIPVAWQGMSLAQMTQQVHDYTKESVKKLVDAGARPDIVQIGNEITPGLLIHICNASGTATSTNSVNGSTSNWNNLAGFLNAGIQGVHDVDPNIKIMLHTDRGGSASACASFISSAQSHGVAFDVFGASTYVAYQGQPTVWQSTFDTLMGNSALSGLRFASAEYNNEAVTSPAGTTSMRAINDIIFGMADNRGFGTFFWEPTRSGAWGNGLFTWSGHNCTAIASAFAVYDQMKAQYATRL